jgi:hypothetical protein
MIPSMIQHLKNIGWIEGVVLKDNKVIAVCGLFATLKAIRYFVHDKF